LQRAIAEKCGLADVATLSLRERVNKAKQKWLQRVMYHPDTSLAGKCFGYVVADALNCVTLDCWVAQPTIAERLGWSSSKSVQRAAKGLSKHGLIVIKDGFGRPPGRRYEPVFLHHERDIFVPRPGQNWSNDPGKDVRQSSLRIPHRSSSTEEAAERRSARVDSWCFNPRERGAFEKEVAERLGADGWEVLTRLGEADDAYVDRLCGACAAGWLQDCDLIAARLASQQLGKR